MKDVNPVLAGSRGVGRLRVRGRRRSTGVYAVLYVFSTALRTYSQEVAR